MQVLENKMFYLYYTLLIVSIGNIQYLAFDDFNGAVITFLSGIVAFLYFIFSQVKK